MSSGLRRRELLVGAGSLATLSALPCAHTATQPASGPLAGATTFLATLSPDTQREARFEFGGRTHRAWNFMGTRAKPGLLIERMTAEQKDSAYALLQSVLSQSGYEKARLVMATQDVMRQMGRGPSGRNSERFSIAIFGEPADNNLWGLRIEGHHLSLNWTLNGPDLVAITPASFSVIPQTIPVGARNSTIVLEQEEFLARRLLTDLGGQARARAVIAERTPGNVMALAGRENRFSEKRGLAAADLGSGQTDLLWELIETTAVAPWPRDVAAQQRQRIREGDRDAVHFAWAGSAERGEMFYYRIHGDTFTIELASVFGDPEHLHATFHDPVRTFGRHMT
jgi:hypothetical protein